MNEIKIELSEVNPREFFGQQNVHIDQIKSYFPKLKIVARGSTLKAYGEETLLGEFDKRIEMLQAHFGKYNMLDKETIDRVIQASSAEEYDPALETESFILHGVGGKAVKAKTINQLKLVELVNENDMVFAIGPAGTGKTYTSVALSVRALKALSLIHISEPTRPY